MTVAGGESLASQCGAGKGLSLYQSNREGLIPLKDHLHDQVP